MSIGNRTGIDASFGLGCGRSEVCGAWAKRMSCRQGSVEAGLPPCCDCIRPSGMSGFAFLPGCAPRQRASGKGVTLAREFEDYLRGKMVASGTRAAQLAVSWQNLTRANAWPEHDYFSDMGFPPWEP
jgi:hypothetical protein